MNRVDLRPKAVLFAGVLLAVVVWVNAGNLNPPVGPVSPTMKDLATVEPRTPISSLPFSITSPGSYYVTKDLTGVSGQHGIIIGSSEVSLDLCGFTVRGTGGSMNGIHVNGARSKIRIENGIVSGWGGDGLNTQTADKTTIVMLMTRDNGGSGASSNGDTTVLYMSANNNGSNGLVLGDCCICKDVECCGNGGDGIRTGSGCKVEDCVASANDGNGLTIAAGSIVTICTALTNGVDGINVADGCTVKHCTVRANNNDGIEAASQCFVLENNASGNGAGANDGAGIHIFSATGGGTRVESNNCVNNDRNFEVGSVGNLIVKNSSTGGGAGGINGTGYYIVPTNAVGPITIVAGTLNFSAGPWANLQY